MLTGKQNIVIFVVVTVAVFIFWNIQAWFQQKQQKKKETEGTAKEEFSQQDASADADKSRR
jgi:cytoskeletal protein RodZ